MKKTSIILTLCSLISFSCIDFNPMTHSNPVDPGYGGFKRWSLIISGSGSEIGSRITPTSDGGCLVAGDVDANNNDGFFAKISSEGTVEWQKTFGGAATYERCGYVLQNSDGSYMLTGVSSLFTGNALIMKLGTSLSPQWGYNSGENLQNDYGYIVVPTSDGGYLVGGVSISSGVDNDVFLQKYNGSGSPVWYKRYGNSGSVNDNEELRDMHATSDGGFIIAGTRQTMGTKYDLWIIKIDSSGSIIWGKTYGGSGATDDYRTCIALTSDGGYIVSGGGNSFGAGTYDAYAIKIDSVGSVEWAKSYGGTAADYSYAVVTNTKGGYVLVGGTQSYGAGGLDAWTVELDVNGTIVSQRVFGGPGLDWFLACRRAVGGGILATGQTATASGNDILIAKLDETGDLPGATNRGTSTATASSFTPTTGSFTPAHVNFTTYSGGITTETIQAATLTLTTQYPY